jgi:nitric-oxide synthase
MLSAQLVTLLAATAALVPSALQSARMPPRRVASPPSACASEPDLSDLIASAEDFLDAQGIGDEASAPPAKRAASPARKKAPKKAPKLSKSARQRVGCYGCGEIPPPRPQHARCSPLRSPSVAGCSFAGASLQCEQPAAAGYVEQDRYELKAMHRQLRLLLCRRCRALSHGEILPAVVEGRLRTAAVAEPLVDVAAATSAAGAPASSARADLGAAGDDVARSYGIGVTTPEELRAELAPLREQKILAVLLVDVCDVTGSFLPRVRDLIGGNPIVLIGTKLDLLPKGTRPEAVLAWLYTRISPRLTVLDAHLVSARTGEGVEAASQAILRERKGRDTFILGAANVGKSLFVGSFLEQALGGKGRRLPISSATPGTTLRLIGLDCFEGGSMLFDTPGLHLAHRLSASLLPDELRAILPRGRVKPYTPVLDGHLAGTSFFWGGLVRVDVLAAPLCARLTFVSPYTLRVSHVAGGAAAATAHYDAEVGRTLTPPLTRESAAQLGELEMAQRVELSLAEMEQAVDVSISGLGWVSVGALASLRKAKGVASMDVVLEVYAPRGVQVSLRPPMPISGLPNDVPIEALQSVRLDDWGFEDR